MLTIDVITLFPDWIESYASTSILGRAQEAGVTKIRAINPRTFTNDAHHKVDDAPYGGGAGMVMMCKPLMDTFESLGPLGDNARVLVTSPLGKPFTQSDARALSRCDRIVWICGHYEGIDERLFDLIPQAERVSLGDFVMTGGELAALAMIDSTVRLLPGALGTEESLQEESFSDGLLEYPHYTRPAEFNGLPIPPVLLSGNHGEIARWRRAQSLERTRRFRPDLLASAPLSPADRTVLNAIGAAE